MEKTARSKLPVSKLAPLAKSARRAAEKECGRQMTDTEIVTMFAGAECREVPTKIAVMDMLLIQAWRLVHRLEDSGVRFAGSSHDATLVIAGTAYAAWRISLSRSYRSENDAHPAFMAAGINDGLEFAIRNKSGIPAMYADDYLNVVSDSKDPIDKMTPMQALAQVWPRRYPAGRLRMEKPRFTNVETSLGSVDVFWGYRPNVLTAGRRELQRAKAAVQKKLRKAEVARKPKAK